jgi:acetoin utilization deacetylase AcuC-like enzyme
VAVAVFTHPDCVRHDPGSDHPESPARLRAVLGRLRAESGLTVRDGAPAAETELLAIHPPHYLRLLEEMSAGGGGTLFLDTVMNRASWAAAIGAAGAVIAGVNHAHGGEGHAFAAVRPPGHHALASKGMGFCLLANAMIAARCAQRLGRERVLIVDWDVHHGNGTQALMERDPSLRYVSLHQWPWYPGTGAADERGVGNVFNVPRGPGKPPALYVEDLWVAIVAATAGWRPDLLLISAGFDAMKGDPLGGFTLEPVHYAELTRRLREHLPDVPIVGLLEGGYVPDRLAAGVLAHVKELS